jgi:hypothetical protein
MHSDEIVDDIANIAAAGNYGKVFIINYDISYGEQLAYSRQDIDKICSMMDQSEFSNTQTVGNGNDKYKAEMLIFSKQK